MWNRIRYDERPEDGPLECSDASSFLTALFDGEASEAEAQRARAHLLACQQCAQLWLQWNQARTLLRQEPVPIPPPTLLWRVLFACRLSQFGVGRKSTAGKAASSRQAQPTLASGSAPRDLQVAPPADMKARLLAATVGTAPAPVYRRRSLAARWLSMPAAMVPVMAMWLMALNWRELGAVFPDERTRISAITPQSDAQFVAANGFKGINRPVVRWAGGAALTAHTVVGSTHGLPAQAVQSSSGATLEDAEAGIASAQIRAASWSANPVARSSQRVSRDHAAALVEMTLAAAEPQPEAPAAPARVEQPAIRPAVMTADISGVHSSRASFAPVHAVRTDSASASSLRASPPVATDTARPAPVLMASAPREASSNTDDTPDPGFAEVRSVVNDYRALFASDTPAATDDAS